MKENLIWHSCRASCAPGKKLLTTGQTYLKSNLIKNIIKVSVFLCSTGIGKNENVLTQIKNVVFFLLYQVQKYIFYILHPYIFVNWLIILTLHCIEKISFSPNMWFCM